MSMTEFNKGDKIKAVVGVVNESDGYSGDYTLYITLKDANDTQYFLQKDSSGNYLYSTTGAAEANRIKEYMATGTTYAFDYTAKVPDMADGDVKAKVEIYDNTGSTFIIGTEYESVFTFKKKKYHLSSLGLEFQNS